MRSTKHRRSNLTNAVIAIGLAVALTLALAVAAQAWPGPVPGQPVCLPVGDGTFHIAPVGTPPFPRGSHQPEHGTCEGPVVPVVPPVVTPAPPAAPPTVVTVVQQVPVPVPVDNPALVCTSRRVYHFLTRTRLGGQRVIGVKSVVVRGKTKYGSYTRVHRGGRVRFKIAADYRGLVVPKGQLRTVVVFLKLAAGNGHPARTRRTVQFLRLCLANDGNPNDSSTQDRARR